MYSAGENRGSTFMFTMRMERQNETESLLVEKSDNFLYSIEEEKSYIYVPGSQDKLTMEDKCINETSQRSSYLTNSPYSNNLKSDYSDKHFVHDAYRPTYDDKDEPTFREEGKAEDMEEANASASDSLRSNGITDDKFKTQQSVNLLLSKSKLDKSLTDN